MISGMPLFLCLRLISCLSGISFFRTFSRIRRKRYNYHSRILFSCLRLFSEFNSCFYHSNAKALKCFCVWNLFRSRIFIFYFSNSAFGVSTFIFNVSSSSGSNESCVSNPPANEGAAPEEPASHAPVNPFPYQADEVIGGDSVLSIQQRLLQKFGNPSSEEIDRARIEAEDLFEVKVDIIRQMETLIQSDEKIEGARMEFSFFFNQLAREE